MSHFLMPRNALATAACTALLMLAGCATPPASSVGTTADVEVPGGWTTPVASAASTPPAEGAAGQAWWRAFGSPELDALVDAALAANRDLRVLAARVAQARAVVDMADASRAPQLAGHAETRRGRSSSADPKSALVAAGVRASWEIDLFGRLALESSAAANDAQAAAWQWQAARVGLAADVAAAYFELQTLQRREGAARESLATLERQVAVASRRFEAGQATALDRDRLAAESQQQHAGVAQLQGAQRTRLRQLAVLLGQPAPVAAFKATAAPAPEPVAPVLPGELLERRPDVQARARALDAAFARLGVARSEVYPRLQLDWAGQRERLSIDGAATAAPRWVVGWGVALSLPLLDGGRIRAGIAANEARVQQVMAEYEQAMLVALAEAEVALARWAAAESQVLALRRAMDSAAQAARHGERLFDAGQADMGAVLDVRREFLRAQDAAWQAEGERWAAAVALRRAFAGGV